MMDIIIASIEKAKQEREQFLRNETALGKQYPKGLKAYFSQRVFELKQKAKRETLIGAAWVNSGCPEIARGEMRSILDILDKQSNTRVQSRLPLQTRLHNLQEDETDPFFRLYEQIKALEGIRGEETNTPHTLEDIFQPMYREHFMRFVEILKEVDPPLINVDGEWIGVKGAAKVFKEALETEGVIFGRLSRNTIYTAFEFFPNLGKSFMKVGVYLRAEDYRADFLHMIQQIKTEI